MDDHDGTYNITTNSITSSSRTFSGTYLSVSFPARNNNSTTDVNISVTALEDCKVERFCADKSQNSSYPEGLIQYSANDTIYSGYAGWGYKYFIVY
jgi:hypothetical protein